MFGQGDLKFVILRLLAEKPRHGYEIIKELEERSGGTYSPSPGTVYPTLVMLEDVLCANIDALFVGGSVEGAHLFRVVRDADLELDQADAEDLLQTVEGRLKQLRHGPVSMLQLDPDMPARTIGSR